MHEGYVRGIANLVELKKIIICLDV